MKLKETTALIPLRLGLKVEEFAEEVKGTGHLFVEPFCRVLGDFVVNLKQEESIFRHHCV